LKKIKLTKSKAKWYAERPNQNIIKGTPLGYNVDIQRKMKVRLESLVEQLTKETQKELEKLFKQDNLNMTFDADISSSARILLNALNKKFTKLFSDKGLFYSESMVKSTDKTVSSNLHQSFKELSGGLTIKTSDISGKTKSLMKASISESTSLIKSIQAKYLDDVAGQVYRSITSGEGLKSLVPYLEKQKGVTKRRAKTIALDQSRKTMTTVSRSKMQEAGIKKFMWHHSSAGAFPREIHQDRDGKIYSFDDLPLYNGVPDFPSWQVNCRCTFSPVIEFNEEN